MEEKFESEFFDSNQLAVYLNISKKAIIRWRNQGRIPGACRISNRWRFRKIEVEKRLINGIFLLPKNI